MPVHYPSATAATNCDQDYYGKEISEEDTMNFTL